jgi:integrase
MIRFTSAFALKIEAMLKYRIARGFKEETHLRNLIRFDKFCTEYYPQTDELTSKIVYAWLEYETLTTPKVFSKRATTIRQFGIYLTALNEQAYVLPEKLSTNRNGFTPYIFTDNELTALFVAIDTLPDDKNEPFLNVISPVLFRMIYTCGLRPNEGRKLLCQNINLSAGEISIINTKHNKDRIVIMSDDMREMCRSYDLKRNIFGGDSPYFFPAKDGEAFKSSKILAAFSKAWIAATCSAQNPIPQRVRIYDLRHRFASACLNRWLDDKRNLMVMLPYLREYMGHNSLNETAYYIHILPENLTKSSAVDWKKFNDMFPEVNIQ